MTIHLKSKQFKELVDQILDNFTIDPEAKLSNGLTASERMRTYILAAIDNIERELD